MANNAYTTSIVTTNPILTTGSGILDNPSSFPPQSGYKMRFTPKPGNQIRAAQFKSIKNLSINNVDFNLSLFGSPNSHTEWPSRFQFTAPGLGDVDTTTASGFKEFPSFYKVVFEDTTNPTNDPGWDFNSFGNSNKVQMWIYFGKNETTGMSSLNNIVVNIDVDYHPVAFTLTETTTPEGVVSETVINSFNI